MKESIQIINYIDKPAVVIDTNFVVLHANTSLKKLLGNREIEEKSIFSVFPELSKNEINIAKTEGNVTLPLKINGHAFYYDIECFENKVNENTLLILIFNLKSKKISTDTLSLEILNSINDPIGICRDDGESIYQNKAFQELLTYNIESDTSPSDYININLFLNDIVLSARKTYSAYISIRKDNKVLSYDVKKMPVFNYNGSNYIVTILRDINFFSQTQNECYTLSNYLEAVNKVSSILIRTNEPQEVAGDILQILGEATNACYAAWHEVITKNDKFLIHTKAFWKKSNLDDSLNLPQSTLSDHEIDELINKLNQNDFISILGNDCITNKWDHSAQKDCKIKAKLLIPMQKNGNIRGIIEFGRCLEERPWNAKEIELLKTGVQNFEVSLEKYIYNKELGLFKEFIQSSPGQWVILDGELSVIFANNTFKNFHKIPTDLELRGKKYTEILPLPCTEKDLELIKKSITERNPVTIDDFFENKMGEKRFLSKIFLPLFKENGDLQSIGIISRDITELKNLKSILSYQDKELSLLLSAINQLPVSLVITDENGNIEYANPAFERITGYTRPEYIGKKTNILKSGKHSDEYYKELWDTISSGNIWTGQFINKKKDGSLFEESAIIVPITDEGKITGYIAIKEDITEKSKLEQQLIQTQKLETAATLAGGMAHDFNNLIGSIQSILELMKLKGEIKEESENLEKIFKIIERAKGITGQILLITRPVIQEEQLIEINKYITETLSILRETTDRKINFETELHPKDIFIKIDPSMLSQILLNIIINSIQAMPNGGIIKVKTLRYSYNDKTDKNIYSTNDRDVVLIEISDTGEGIDPVTLGRIFDPFFTTKPQGKGTGLGLTIVDRIVKKLNGKIYVESEKGKGTKFSIYLPILKENEEYSITETSENLNKTIKEKDHLPEPCIEDTSNYHIAIIDDEAFLRESLKEGLSAFNYKVTEFGSGLDAIETFTENPHLFDVVILDMNMPDINGLETIEKIREIREDIPAILITGFATDEKIKIFREMKNTMILQKPFRLNDIDCAIKTIVNQTRKAKVDGVDSH